MKRSNLRIIEIEEGAEFQPKDKKIFSTKSRRYFPQLEEGNAYKHTGNFPNNT